MGVFIDTERQKTLERDGVVKFKLLDQDLVDELQSFFDGLHSEIKDKFYVCIESSDYNYKKHIHLTVKKKIEKTLNQHLKDFRALVYTMQVKGVGENSELGVHQDWSVTDEESKYRSYSLWIPLIDTTIENGGIFAIKGSHRICKNLRAPSVASPYYEQESYLRSKMEHIPVKAGEALLFDQAMLHYSPANRSDRARVSVISTVIDKEAELKLYYLNKEGETDKLEAYSSHDQFWLDYENYANDRFEKPKSGKLLSSRSFSAEKFDKEKFESQLCNLGY